MPRQQENPVTSQLVRLLRYMSPGWEFEEQQQPLEGSQRQPDVMVTRPGHQTVAIEAKWADAAADGVKQVCSRYLGRKLSPDFVGVSDTLRAAMVIRYPSRFRNKRGAAIQALLKQAADLEYLLIGETAGEPYQFPPEGYARGTLADIATALQVGAVPSQRLDAAAAQMEYDIHVAAKWLDASIANIPAIGQKLHDILEQAPGEQTSRMACLILTDAFVFQNALAGKAGMETVRPLSYYKVHPMQWTEVVADWEAILAVNYQPIFKDAERMVREAFLYDEAMADKVLEKLWEAADTLVASHLPQLHELAGEVFQKLVIDRKYVKANYTLPTSAALLSALVCPNLPDDGALPKVADYACGTGALLNGVYKRIQRLYEQKTGKSSVTIHRHMLENNLAGTDIYSHCTHLTFAAMASAHPEVTLGATRVITAPYGLQADNTYKTGALELLDSQLLFDPMETEGEQVGGENSATAELKREFPDGEMDIVIINPPFARPGADNATESSKTHFQSHEYSDAVKGAMQEALAQKDIRVANGINGLGSYFVDMADRKLKNGGVMGFILLSTILTGAAMNKVRRMLAEEYHDVLVLTIAGASGYDSAFSADTSMAECIVVATKGVAENTGRAKFVCLSKRPESLLSAQTLAENIRRQPVIRRLEDAPHGSDELMVGDVCMGQMLECPIDENEWSISRVASMSLVQTAYHLRQGKLHLPQMMDGNDVPVCQLREVAQVGYSHRDIKDKGKRGAFELRERSSGTQDGYDALWVVNAPLQRAMVTEPDYKAKIKTHNAEKARRILNRNSRTHYHTLLGFTANSVIASWTEEPSIGVSSLTNIVFSDSRYEAAWTLWTNSTLGLLCHWMQCGKQQPGRGKMVLTNLGPLLTLDVYQLSEEQLAAAERVFADLKAYRMKPYNECATDAWRHVLDARFLAEVLGITDAEVHRGMQRLREMLCAEPSITGTKQNPADLAAEREKHQLPGSEVAEKEALAREQRALSVRGIPLPGVLESEGVS